MADDEPEDEMDEEDASSEEGDEEEGGQSGGKKKLILIIAGVVLVVLIGVGVMFALGVFDSLLGQGEAEVEEVIEIPPGPPVYHDFPQIHLQTKTRGADEFRCFQPRDSSGCPPII